MRHFGCYAIAYEISFSAWTWPVVISLAGHEIVPLQPFGGKVRGLDLRTESSVDQLARIEREIAQRGFVVVPEQIGLQSERLLNVSSCFGGRKVVGRHTVHPLAVHEDILRLSNKAEHGIPFVGGQWHNDGSFERRVFSHSVFHAQVMPTLGGETEIADLAAAYASLPVGRKEDWARLASVNAYSGVVHPLVHRHPISNKPVLFLHLSQTGAVIRWPHSFLTQSSACHQRRQLEAMEPHVGFSLNDQGYEVLNANEMTTLFNAYNELLNRKEHRITYNYSLGDLLILDNLAVAHRAAPSAHNASHELRIVHRTTVQGAVDLDPPCVSGLPTFLHIFGKNPLEGDGIWQGADYYGAGFRWNHTIWMQN